jgi:predicted NUDIX family NTP pyrophosphohydrolase
MAAAKQASAKANLSARILAYRSARYGPEVLLVHPGGPYWRKKDDGAWSIPKGEIDMSEDPEQAACREFAEELGPAASIGPLRALGDPPARRQTRDRLLRRSRFRHGVASQQFLRDRVAARERPSRSLSGGRPRRVVRPGYRPIQDPAGPDRVARPTRKRPGMTRCHGSPCIGFATGIP